jgi:hypothetical protein
MQGRFLNIDPWRLEENLYIYATSNPINLHDPSGSVAEIPNIPNTCLPSNPDPRDHFSEAILADLTALERYGVYVVSGTGADIRDRSLSPDEQGEITEAITTNILHVVESYEDGLVATINNLYDRAGINNQWRKATDGSAFYYIFTGGYVHIQIMVLPGEWADKSLGWRGWNTGRIVGIENGVPVAIVPSWDIRIAEEWLADGDKGPKIVAHELAHNITWMMNRGSNELWLEDNTGFGVLLGSSSDISEITADGIASWGLDLFTGIAGSMRATDYMEHLVWKYMCLGRVAGSKSDIPFGWEDSWCDPDNPPEP